MHVTCHMHGSVVPEIAGRAGDQAKQWKAATQHIINSLEPSDGVTVPLTYELIGENHMVSE